jgi:hypothetical protein
MNMPMTFICGLEPLVGIGSAGPAARSLAGHYVGELSRRASMHGDFAFMTPNGEGFRQPPVLVVIWMAADERAAADLQAWSRHLDRDRSQIVVGVCIGGAPPASWPHRVLRLPQSGSYARDLTAALDCIAEMLLAPNLVNLRIHELRDVLAAGPELKFAAGWAGGEACVQEALQAALSEPEVAARPHAVRGLWMHVSSPSMPSLADLQAALSALRRRSDESTVTWGGATASPSVPLGSRVSLLVAVSGEPAAA